MISDINKYQMDERSGSIKLMPPFLVVCILIFIIGYIFFARSLANPMSKEASITVLSTSLIPIEDVKKETERDLETQLTAVLRLIGLQNDFTDHETVYNILSEELKNHVVELTGEDLLLIHNKIIVLQEIVGQEQSNNFREMSLEGRKLIIHLTKEIYELYGFHLSVNLDGDIEKISDSTGSMVYSKSHLNIPQIQFKGFILILSVVFLALLICILFAKKNQLFKKDVRYDGLNEKRYA